MRPTESEGDSKQFDVLCVDWQQKHEMATVAIPPWNSLGVFPPNDPAAPISFTRSPYAVSLVDVVSRFATSPERIVILEGFLDYRKAVHALGYIEGFQWLNGSFCEDVETLELRKPADIDIVTFNHDLASPIPDGADISVLDHASAKTTFKVDSYWVELDALPRRMLPFVSAYWYSMWSHRRTQTWKGFLQVDLAPNMDSAARACLTSVSTTRGATP